MRRLRDLMGLLLLAAMGLGGCETSSNLVRPPKPVEEYRDPPENDARYSGYIQYPKETMDQDVLLKKAKDKANSTPNPMGGPRGRADGRARRGTEPARASGPSRGVPVLMCYCVCCKLPYRCRLRVASHEFQTKSMSGFASGGQRHMLVDIECQVRDGLRPQEATVMIKDYHGEKHFMPLDRGLLEAEGSKHYMSVFLIKTDPRTKSALVALPIEADSGAYRIWVKLKDLKDLPEGVSA